MSPFTIYIIKSSAYLAGFYIVYAIFLRSDTFYLRNRFFILSSVFFSFILPFLNIDIFASMNLPVIGKVLSEVLVTGDGGNSSENDGVRMLTTGSPVLTLYLTVAVILGLKLLKDMTELIFLIIRNKKVEKNIIHFIGFKTSGFSAFGHVFINAGLSKEEAMEIINHEQSHLEYNHSIDIMVIEIAKIIQWFNPAIYLFDRSLREVHEFQADEKCLKKGISIIAYQGLLLNQVFGSKAFSFTNSFSHPTLIKKRMIMMTKKRSGTMANLKLLLVLPVVAITMILISSCGENTDQSGNKTEIAPPPPPPPPPPPVAASDSVFSEADVMAQFPGGDQALMIYIAKNTRYPEDAKNEKIQGKVIVQFDVLQDCTVANAIITKGVYPSLDMEALRVVMSLPKFEKPAIKDGKTVAVRMFVPINYRLQ